MIRNTPISTPSFRPVRSEDKNRIIELTFNTWGDNEDDYIKDVFDDWLDDPRGEFTAAVLDDQVIGIAKLTDMGDGEWWLEGLRVDPAYRRRGIAIGFNRYHVDLARRWGGKVMRYTTRFALQPIYQFRFDHAAQAGFGQRLGDPGIAIDAVQIAHQR